MKEMLNIADRRGLMNCVSNFSHKIRSLAPTHTLWDIIQGIIRHKVIPDMLNNIHDIL